MVKNVDGNMLNDTTKTIDTSSVSTNIHCFFFLLLLLLLVTIIKFVFVVLQSNWSFWKYEY